MIKAYIVTCGCLQVLAAIINKDPAARAWGFGFAAWAAYILLTQFN